MYERGGSLNVIRLPAAGGSSRCGATRSRIGERVDRLQIGARQRLAGEHARRHDVFPLEHELALAVEIAIEHQHGRLARGVIDRRDEVDERHAAVAREIGLQSGPH